MISLELSIFFLCTQNYIDLIGNIYIQSRTAFDFGFCFFFKLDQSWLKDSGAFLLSFGHRPWLCYSLRNHWNSILYTSSEVEFWQVLEKNVGTFWFSYPQCMNNLRGVSIYCSYKVSDRMQRRILQTGMKAIGGCCSRSAPCAVSVGTPVVLHCAMAALPVRQITLSVEQNSLAVL